MSSFGFGIDGGGTRSRLCIFDWDTGEEVIRCVGESTNMYSVGTQNALDNTLALLRQAGVSFDTFRGGCIGSAGLSRPMEQQVWRTFFRENLPDCPMYLCNDGETLLVGSLRSKSGYCLISGTGSLALGRSETGENVRAGGLGYMLGDEGSGLWIGWQAIMRSIRSKEQRDLPTELLPVLLEHFSLGSADDFVAMMHQRFKKSEIASAAQCVLERVESDPLAHDIAVDAVLELTLLVRSVVESMPVHPMRLALAGGVLEHSEWMSTRLQRTLQSIYPQMEFVTGQGDAVMGACMLAREAAQGK